MTVDQTNLAPIDPTLTSSEQTKALRFKLMGLRAMCIQDTETLSPVPPQDLDAFLADNPALKWDLMALDFNEKDKATTAAVAVAALNEFIENLHPAIVVKTPLDGSSPNTMKREAAVQAGYVVMSGSGDQIKYEPAPGFEWADTREDSENYAVVVEGAIHEESSFDAPVVKVGEGAELSDVEKVAFDLEEMGYTDVIWNEFLTNVSTRGLPDRSAYEIHDIPTDKMYANKCLELGNSPSEFAKRVKGMGGLKDKEVDWLRMAAPRYMRWHEIHKRGVDSGHWTDDSVPTVNIIEVPKDRTVTVTLQRPADWAKQKAMAALIDVTRSNLTNLDDSTARQDFEKLVSEYTGAQINRNVLTEKERADQIVSFAEGIQNEWDEMNNMPQGSTVVANGAVALQGDKVEKAPETVKPSINDEANFITSMHEDGWKRLATLEETNDDGKVVITLPNDRTSPDYLYSRIHHFLGKAEAVKAIKDPSKYNVTINGKPAEWKATDTYKDGTWVDSETDKRFLVETGTTTIKWEKKPDEPTVAAVFDTDRTPVKDADKAVLALAALEKAKAGGKTIELIKDSARHIREILAANPSLGDTDYVSDQVRGLRNDLNEAYQAEQIALTTLKENLDNDEQYHVVLQTNGLASMEQRAMAWLEKAGTEQDTKRGTGYVITDAFDFNEDAADGQQDQV